MSNTLSPNAQVILLLTAPLIAGRGSASADLLKPSILFERLKALIVF